MPEATAEQADEFELSRTLGSLLIVGLEGTSLTAELDTLIRNRSVGAVLLRSKNLQSVAQTTDLINSLQRCAHEAGHDRPLLIAVDQENGSLNSLTDERITQFPSAMGLAAAADPQLTQQVAAATAYELHCLGVNWILGPVLDVAPVRRPSTMGTRTFGDNPVTVLTHGLSSVQGFRSSGVACCGKHFPTYGEVHFPDGTEQSLPLVKTSLKELQRASFTPFRACAQAGLDAILVGGCSLDISGRNIRYACLSNEVVTGMLRRECHFQGVIVSECLTMDALCEDIGLAQGVSMALGAGCDMIMICQTPAAQLEGIDALKKAVYDGTVSMSAVYASAQRVNTMKDTCTSWEQALHPKGPAALDAARHKHALLSEKAYKAAVSIVRDSHGDLATIRAMCETEQILLLTPLISLFPSTATREAPLDDPLTIRTSHPAPDEKRFQSFGAALSQKLAPRLVHTSYSSNGISRLHEQLISQSSAVILFTADTARNKYQYGVTKVVSMQCRLECLPNGLSKPFIVVALTSPDDFLSADFVHTYICTYDFTEPSLDNVIQIIVGSLEPASLPPLEFDGRSSKGSLLIGKDKRPSTTWLVDNYQAQRDRRATELLLRTRGSPQAATVLLELLSSFGSNDGKSKLFVVRNNRTNAVFGILAASASDTAKDGWDHVLFVDPARLNEGIEQSLYQYAMIAMRPMENSDIDVCFR